MSTLRLPSVKPKVYGACLRGGKAQLFQVECLVERGLPRVQLVGLPDLAAREARDRLPAAFAAHALPFPKSRVLFNLAPADLPKAGYPVDLALALALLVATQPATAVSTPILALGELDLLGQVREPSRGVILAAAAACAQAQPPSILIAPTAATEASLLPKAQVRAVSHLGEVMHWLRQPQSPTSVRDVRQPLQPTASVSKLCLSDLRGQAHARDAAIYAVAGRHSLLLQGPPGTGKSMLARRIADLMPPLNEEQALALAALESIHGPVRGLPTRAPFRAPHHTISAQALLGGGRPIRPGEISRAHGGVLFLDELPEFTRPALEGLRQPLEEGEVRIERCNESAIFPARPLLVCARNPCPCGYASHPTQACRCTPAVLDRYQRRTSGPLLDRMDLFVEMGPVPPAVLHGPPSAPTTTEALAQLALARETQQVRLDNGRFGVASLADQDQILDVGVDPASHRRLLVVADRLQWSGRALLRTLRLARTIADCHGDEHIQEAHLHRAMAYRAPLNPAHAPHSTAAAATD